VGNATKPSSWSLTRGARGNLRAQDVVLVPRFEHHSNIAVLRHEPWIVSRDTPVR
jgi:selenocysteine lyase/cysteine desulfurase